jgi:hypothetical protein
VRDAVVGWACSYDRKCIRISVEKPLGKRYLEDREVDGIDLRLS